MHLKFGFLINVRNSAYFFLFKCAAIRYFLVLKNPMYERLSRGGFAIVKSLSFFRLGNHHPPMMESNPIQ
jgi:hypothetical protein